MLTMRGKVSSDTKAYGTASFDLEEQLAQAGSKCNFPSAVQR